MKFGTEKRSGGDRDVWGWEIKRSRREGVREGRRMENSGKKQGKEGERGRRGEMRRVGRRGLRDEEGKTEDKVWGTLGRGDKGSNK